MASDEIATLGLRIDTRSFETGLRRADSGMASLGDTATRVAAAIAAAFTGNRITNAFRQMVAVASGAREDLAQFEHVMRNVTRRSKEWVDVLTASEFGRTSREAQVMLMNLTSLAKGMEMTDRDALELAGSVSKLSIDIGSFMAKNPSDVVEAFQSALIGNTMALRTYGVVLNDEIIKSEMARQATEGRVFANERAARASAILAIATKQQADAIGDFAVESGGFSNQIKAISGNLDELYAKLGKALLEPATAVVTSFNNILISLRNLDDGTARYIVRAAALATGIGTVGSAVYAVTQVLRVRNAILAAGAAATARSTQAETANTTATVANTTASTANTTASTANAAAVSTVTAAITAQTTALTANTAARAANTTVGTQGSLFDFDSTRPRQRQFGFMTASTEQVAREYAAERAAAEIASQNRLARLQAAVAASSSSSGTASAAALSYANRQNVSRVSQMFPTFIAGFGRLGQAGTRLARVFTRLTPLLTRVGGLFSAALGPVAVIAGAAASIYGGLRLLANLPDLYARAYLWIESGEAKDFAMRIAKGFISAIQSAFEASYGLLKDAVSGVFQMIFNRGAVIKGARLDQQIQAGNERRDDEAAGEKAEQDRQARVEGLLSKISNAWEQTFEHQDKIADSFRFDALSDVEKLKEWSTALSKVDAELAKGFTREGIEQEKDKIRVRLDNIAKEHGRGSPEYQKAEEEAEKEIQSLTTQSEKIKQLIDEQARLWGLVNPLQKKVDDERSEASKMLADFYHDLSMGEAKNPAQKIELLEKQFKDYEKMLGSLSGTDLIEHLQKMHGLVDQMRQLEEIRLPPQARVMQASQAAVQAASVQARELENRIFQQSIDKQLLEAKKSNELLKTIKDTMKTIQTELSGGANVEFVTA